MTHAYHAPSNCTYTYVRGYDTLLHYMHVTTSAMSLLLLASMCCGHITRLLYGRASLIYACQMTHLYAGLLICVSAFESRVIRIQTVLNSVLSTVNSVLQCVAQCVASRNASNTRINSPQRISTHFVMHHTATYCNTLNTHASDTRVISP